MNENYVIPAKHINSFNCPFCGAFAHQKWDQPFDFSVDCLDFPQRNSYAFSTCQSCELTACWFESQIVFPPSTTAPLLHSDCPDEIRTIIEEARAVYPTSPRASAALLRLALQVFVETILHISENSINDEIAVLVKQKKISSRIQKAMDVLRVIGNNAVHPGKIDLNDDPQIALSLFGLINVIIEETITRDKHINAMFDALPNTVKKSIEKRDDTK